jgi:hypothetical protein
MAVQHETASIWTDLVGGCGNTAGFSSLCIAQYSLTFIVRCTIKGQPRLSAAIILHWAQYPFRRTTMNQPFETVQKLGKDSFGATVKALEVATTGTQAIVVETADYA